MMVVGAILFSCFAQSLMAEKYGKSKGHDRGFDSKLFYKVILIMKNQEELRITDKQLEKIKKLKIQVKKDLIKVEAEIDIVAVDIKAAFYEDDIDTKAINKLIDKKYNLKKQKAKTLVGAYAQLSSILTEEQKEDLKLLIHSSKRSLPIKAVKANKRFKDRGLF